MADVETTSVGGPPTHRRYSLRPHHRLFRGRHPCPRRGLLPGDRHPPERKYQEDGGPSLRHMAGIFQSTDPDSLDALLRLPRFTSLSAMATPMRNYSLVHEPSGALHLAPAYDVMSTLFYGDDRLAMHIECPSHRPCHIQADSQRGSVLGSLPGGGFGDCRESPRCRPCRR